MKTIKGIIFSIEEIEELNKKGCLLDLQLLDDDGDYPDGNCVIVPVYKFSKEEIKTLNLKSRIETIYYRTDYSSRFSNLEYFGKWYAKNCTGAIYFEFEPDSEKIDDFVLVEMATAIKEGVSLFIGYDDSIEFAKKNGFDINLVKDIYKKYDDFLNALRFFYNKEVTLDKIASFLGISVEDHKDNILAFELIYNDRIILNFEFIKIDNPLCNSVVKITDIEEIISDF